MIKIKKFFWKKYQAPPFLKAPRSFLNLLHKRTWIESGKIENFEIMTSRFPSSQNIKENTSSSTLGWIVSKSFSCPRKATQHMKIQKPIHVLVEERTTWIFFGKLWKINTRFSHWNETNWIPKFLCLWKCECEFA